MGILFTVEVGNVLTEMVGKVLDIYNPTSSPFIISSPSQRDRKCHIYITTACLYVKVTSPHLQLLLAGS